MNEILWKKYLNECTCNNILRPMSVILSCFFLPRLYLQAFFLVLYQSTAFSLCFSLLLLFALVFMIYQCCCYLILSFLFFFFTWYNSFLLLFMAAAFTKKRHFCSKNRSINRHLSQSICDRYQSIYH